MTHKLVILLCLFVVTNTALLLPAWGEGDLLESSGGSSVCLSTTSQGGSVTKHCLAFGWKARGGTYL